MQKRTNRPEQLRLALEWDLLKRLNASREEDEYFERTTRQLLSKETVQSTSSPIMDEIVTLVALTHSPRNHSGAIHDHLS